MSEHPNAARIRTAIDAINDRDYETYMGIISDDIVAHYPPPFGTLRGKAEYAQAIKKLDELSGGTMRPVTECVLADDDYAMVFNLGSVERNGEKQVLRFVSAGELDGSGRFKRFWFLPSDAASHEEFWSA